MWGQRRRARGSRVWLEEPGSLRRAVRGEAGGRQDRSGRLPRPGCRPGTPAGEGPRSPGTGTGAGGGTRGATAAAGQQRGAGTVQERRPEEVELCRVSTAPTRWHLWDPGGRAGRASRAGRAGPRSRSGPAPGAASGTGWRRPLARRAGECKLHEIRMFSDVSLVAEILD
ncbi:uncharacterized protein LOC102911309 isoform X2 [Peromyscus maniculatus bairdii]|uniref:uncharacterized protein LOC102911309 isoform X2 n=1 Tax=Peromyscus maniculatus bairdii TaxID=230844 RepID=UPI003FD26F2E